MSHKAAGWKWCTVSNMLATKPLKNRIKSLISLKIINNAKIPGIRAIILFGNGARGELCGSSDLDLLLVTNEKIDSSIRCDIRSVLDEEFRGVRTDIVFYTKEVFNGSESLFMKNIRKDGTILWLQK